MPDQITLTGVVATTPRHITTGSGVDIASFRLASSQRRFDRTQKKWIDAETNWYTVTAFRHLALNVVASLRSGQHVLVTGRLRVRHWESGERSGTAVELEADAVGHDLTWGTGSFTKVIPSSSAPTGDAAGDDASGVFPDSVAESGEPGAADEAGFAADEPSEAGEPALLPF